MIEKKDILEQLKKFGIPKEKKLLFTVGRATPMKGQDIVLKIFYELQKKRKNIHLVMLAPDAHETYGNSEYFIKIQKKIDELGIRADVTVIDEFNTELPIYLYQWENTEIIFTMSRFDSKPLVPMESRAASTNAILLSTEFGGFIDQILDGVDGFMVPLVENNGQITNLEEMVEKSEHLIKLNIGKRLEIVLKAKKRILKDFDFSFNFFNFLKSLFPQKIRGKYQQNYQEYHKQISIISSK